jgi:uncharacterized protein (DUF433 family)
MEALLTQHLESSPDVRGGRVCLAGTRITVEDLALLHLRLGKPLEEIAGTYDLPMAALHTAMAYYYENQDEIERAIQDDIAYAEAFERRNSSPLREKDPQAFVRSEPKEFLGQIRGRLKRFAPERPYTVEEMHDAVFERAKEKYGRRSNG